MLKKCPNQILVPLKQTIKYFNNNIILVGTPAIAIMKQEQLEGKNNSFPNVTVEELEKIANRSEHVIYVFIYLLTTNYNVFKRNNYVVPNYDTVAHI